MLIGMTDTTPRRATAQDGTYPRPQLMRPQWADLSGTWEFAYDDADRGRSEQWWSRDDIFDRTIIVPFPPESAASTIGDTGFHPVVWYGRTLTEADLSASGYNEGDALLLHFGAVDHRAEVWVDGQSVGTHEGGHTPFSVEVPHPVAGARIVVRAEDDPADVSQPRGKQDWMPTPHVIWYDRTTGIWQPVWLESVPTQHITRLRWHPDGAAALIAVDVELARRAAPHTSIRVSLHLGDEHLGTATAVADGQRARVTVAITALANGQDHERLRWSPEHPTLIDAEIHLQDETGADLDAVASYVGLRTVGTAGGHFVLNGFPYQVRAVLEQGYWPESHLAAPSADALRREVELIKQLGFNTARLHQKIEDPRFLFWADILGLLVWAELPSAYEYSDTALQRLTAEWLEVLRRDASHPSVAAWVPFNESWGVGDLPRSEAHRSLTRALYELTCAFDPTRPVISNDGWEHTRSDLFTVHDYENDAAVLAARYADRDAAIRTLSGLEANGRRMMVDDREREALLAAPILVSEFGGVSFDPAQTTHSWGYRVVSSADALRTQLQGVFGALHASTALAGWCYTQLTDTQQETNGLLTAGREPKLPVDVLRAIITGDTWPAR